LPSPPFPLHHLLPQRPALPCQPLVPITFLPPRSFAPAQKVPASCTGPQVVIELVPKVCVLEAETKQVGSPSASTVLREEREGRWAGSPLTSPDSPPAGMGPPACCFPPAATLLLQHPAAAVQMTGHSPVPAVQPSLPASPSPFHCPQVVCDPAKLVLTKSPGSCTHKYISASAWVGKECKLSGEPRRRLLRPGGGGREHWPPPAQQQELLPQALPQAASSPRLHGSGGEP
jgi:hypothetical protein